MDAPAQRPSREGHGRDDRPGYVRTSGAWVALERWSVARLRPHLPLDNFRNLLRPFFQHGQFAAFEQEARFGLGAGVAEEAAATLRLEFGFGAGNELEDIVH